MTDLMNDGRERPIDAPHVHPRTRSSDTAIAPEPAWVKSLTDRAWHFCERAARGEPLTYAEVQHALLPFAGLDKVAPDPRKPWTEPTVTECATTNRKPDALTIPTTSGEIGFVPRSLDGEPWGPDKDALTKRINESLTPHTTANEIYDLMNAIAMDWDYEVEFEKLGLAPIITLTCHRPMIPISGVDLPNPPERPDITQLLHDLEKNARWIGGQDGWGNTDWTAGPKGLDGKGYAADMRAAIAEIQRQAAEIAELQGMMEEAIGPVRLVHELANMTDFECQLQRVSGIRDTARGKLDGDFTMPRLYGEEDHKRAITALLGGWPSTLSHVGRHLGGEVVGAIAAALGLRRAS